MLNIVADENIPLLTHLFSEFGDLVMLPGRAMTPDAVRDADILLVRSVTRVNAGLLDESRVRFVGSCTAGIDHLDVKYLRRQGIAWSNAPGCNANSVVEYVFSVLARLRPEWLEARVGIVGCGNVGGRLYRRLSGLGLNCRVYDPFLAAADNPHLTSLRGTLQSDIVCLHAPLSRDGDFPSFHLLQAQRLESLPQDCLLISAGRGAVVDNSALLGCLERRADLRVALDVWEGEPMIDPRLLDAVQLGTPHIAGYSYDGRVAGSVQVREALLEHLKSQTFPVREGESRVAELRDPLGPEVVFELHERGLQESLNAAILNAYDVDADSQRLKDSLGMQHDDRAAHFDKLRKNYPLRREFHGYGLRLPTAVPQRRALEEKLRWLGFKLASSD